MARTVVGRLFMTKSALLSRADDALVGLRTLLQTFETMMLATIDAPSIPSPVVLDPTSTSTQAAPSPTIAPRLQARLLSVAGVGDDFGLSFFTVARDNLVEGPGHIIAQAMTCSVNLRGSFCLIASRTQMAPFFGKHHQAWFPLGLDEPGLCFLRFHPREAELRDMGRVQRIDLSRANGSNIGTLSRANGSNIGTLSRANGSNIGTLSGTNGSNIGAAQRPSGPLGTAGAVVVGCSALAVFLAGLAAAQVLDPETTPGLQTHAPSSFGGAWATRR